MAGFRRLARRSHHIWDKFISAPLKISLHLKGLLETAFMLSFTQSKKGETETSAA